MLHLHSGLRYVILILLILAIVKSIIGWASKKTFSKGDEKIGLFLMIFSHLQLLIGLFLYMTRGWLSMPFAQAMTDSVSRFWKVEHMFGMIVAIVLITIGRMRVKRLAEDLRKHKASVIFYLIALVLIMGSIKWDMSRLF
ncbi:MAG TPA: cytochrome B [Flavobacteriales bacterium]|nr:cytochrome B [Flavobacteriales bacterium]